ncbi:hypothetical protein A2U01_0071316, partial [Trifolium medium]|nr:hypothetical protein [Trifolium medium]
NGLAMIVDDIWYAKFNNPLDGHWFQEAENVIVQVSLSFKELTCFAPILRTH